MPSTDNVTAYANSTSDVPLTAANQLPVNQTDLVLSWAPAVGPANKYTVLATTRACNEDVGVLDPAYWRRQLLIAPSATKVMYEEVVIGNAPPSFHRFIEGFNYSRIYCLTVVASDLGSNSTVSYFPLTLYAPRWHSYGPTDATAWAAIGVVLAFVVITLVGVTVYLWLKKRQENQVEYAF